MYMYDITCTCTCITCMLVVPDSPPVAADTPKYPLAGIEVTSSI